MDQARTGALIRALRQNKQLTQRQLADAIGVSDKAVSKWERGCGSGTTALGAALAAKKQTRLPYFAHGTLLWYCTRHGLFAQKIDAHKK